MKQSFTISPSDAQARLDVFLSNNLPDMTRSRIAKLLKQGCGTVNGKVASVHRFLKSGDKVEFDDEVKPEHEQKAERTVTATPDIRVLDQTKDWIVLDKPAGLLVHEAEGNHGPTLVDAILKLDPKIAKIGEDPQRPGIVHRLDMEASGLMVVARTQDAFDDLKKQFSGHSVEKRYVALVHGRVNDDEGDIKFRIARSRTSPRMAARPVHEAEGKAAWTHFVTLKRFINASLLGLDIMSGRTHQIRAHLLAIGHPIMGDPLYATGTKYEGRGKQAPRLMLQSVHLAFRDPSTGEKREFDLTPAPEFEEVMKRLK